MKQVVFEFFDTGAQSIDSRVVSNVIWQGGHGWLVIPNFNVGAGSPRMDVEVIVEGISPIPSVDIPTPINASGPAIHPFYAPKGAVLRFSAVVAPGERLVLTNVYLLGDA
jgi:hypothetical protein